MFSGETRYIDPKAKKIAWMEDDYEVAEDGHGIPYYYHTKTGASSRVIPMKVAASIVIPDKEDGEDEDAAALFGTVGNDWEELTDDTGRTYYYSPSTGETQWTKPEPPTTIKKSSVSLWEDPEYTNQFEKAIEKSGKWVYAPLETPSRPGARVYFYAAANGEMVKVEF